MSAIDPVTGAPIVPPRSPSVDLAARQDQFLAALREAAGQSASPLGGLPDAAMEALNRSNATGELVNSMAALMLTELDEAEKADGTDGRIGARPPTDENRSAGLGQVLAAGIRAVEPEDDAAFDPITPTTDEPPAVAGDTRPRNLTP